MEIILKQDVENLGFQNEIVNVKPGYARNYLIPKGMAVAATSSAKKMLEETMRQRAQKEAKIKEEALKTAEALKDAKIVIKTKAGENGRIFGSVTTIQLADAIEKLGYNVNRKLMKIRGEAIKQVGTYEADIRLTKDVSVTVKFDVEKE